MKRFIRSQIGLVTLLLCGLALAETAPAETTATEMLEEQLKAEPPEKLVADARELGDPVRGAAVFYARTMACSSCHSVGDRADSIGPDLAKPKTKLSDAALIEAILEPAKTVAAQYATVSVETDAGKLLVGLLVSDNDDQLVLRDLQNPNKLITIKKAEIEERRQSTESVMPSGQVNQLSSRGQFLDLVRYLIELRDGGEQRARELLPPLDPLAQIVPDQPLPWQPVVQRGEVAVDKSLKYPHGVAIGFRDGTVLFDANQLRVVAAWRDGFVTHSQQNYFGLYWHRDGSEADKSLSGVPPLSFKNGSQPDWQSFEPAATSDPNSGTRFDGYQIGRSSVRLHYRLLVGQHRITVTEDVRVERRKGWQGLSREYRFANVPKDVMVRVHLPDDGAHHLLREQSSPGVKLSDDKSTDSGTRLVSAVARQGVPLVLGVDSWRRDASPAAPDARELAVLSEKSPRMEDVYDPPLQAPSPVASGVEPGSSKVANVPRPAVQPQKNVDEFAAARAKFLRFVVTRTNDNIAPGIDELEVYGTDPKINLARMGKATASSVISGYPIHQIPHLNDGKLGNPHSWISAEKGGGWAQIEFPEPVMISKVIWARDQTGVCKDRLAVAYRIEVSDDGSKWTRVGDERGRAAVGSSVGGVRRDATPGYTLEQIPPPFPACRPSGVAFHNGMMYVIAMTEGQIWRTPIPPVGEPDRVSWQRYATGLYHPIGLAQVDGRLYVAQKPEVTELIDHDGDGKVDHFRTVATGWGLSTGWHEYCFGLGVDTQKNLWFALNSGYFWTHPGFVNPGRWRGSIMRIAHGSEKMDVVAKGCRVPNGIARGPDGGMYFTDNQGDWIQSCKLAHIVPGRFYGHPETKDDALPVGDSPTGLSSIWLPYERSRSVSGPVCDLTGDRFGPFADQMFVGDVGFGANQGVMRVALEKVNGQYQGACFRFMDGQPLGCERMKFGPDHQLYMASLTSGLTRLAFDGKTPFAIQSVRIRPAGKGFVINLTAPIAAGVQLKSEQFRVTRYHYLYSGKYGSPKAGQKAVAVESAILSPDRKSITLTFPVETYPIGMVYEINLGDLKSESDADLVHNEAWYTVHEIPER